jgi:hypothetical protein
LNDPNELAIVRKLYPEYFEKRRKLIEKKLDIERRIAMIKLFGIRSQEDLLFVYALYNGQIEIPKKLVFDTTYSDTDNEKEWTRGWLNYKQFAKTIKVPHPIGTGLLTVEGDLNVDKGDINAGLGNMPPPLAAGTNYSHATTTDYVNSVLGLKATK